MSLLSHTLLNGYRRIRSEWALFSIDLSRLKSFVVFIGNPRSGTTLVRSLLDAHPNVILSNEVHAVKCVLAGDSWRTLAGRIVKNERQFSKKPIWTGYQYRVSENRSQAPNAVYVIGDKKADRTTGIIREDPAVLDRLISWSPVPVRLLHCIRNPYDVIATRTRKTDLSLERNIQHYFQTEQTAELASRIIGPAQYRRIYHEQLIAQPDHTLKDLLSFFDLTAEASYLNACRELIFDQPKKSRFDVDWCPEALASVEQNALACAHLAPYLDQGKLRFGQENDK